MLSRSAQILLLLTTFTANAISENQITTPAFGACPEHLATIEPDGSVSTGSVELLKAAYRAGHHIRVGWELDWDQDGITDITHWANADFLSEFEGTIAAQIPSIRRQLPRPGEGTISLATETTWTGLIDTLGRLQGGYDGDKAREYRVRAHWCMARTSTERTTCSSAQWRLAYHHDNEGNAIEGDKETLFGALRKGYPIRLAWGLRSAKDPAASTAHAMDPKLLSLTHDEHLFAQVPENIAQSFNLPSDVRSADRPAIWQGQIGTDGSFDAAWIDRATGETINHHRQRAKVAWFYFGPSGDCDTNEPINLEVIEGAAQLPH